MRRKARTKFRNTLNDMIELHKEIENEFLAFNELVPYKHNPAQVYSPKLYNIFQSSFAQVISMMQHIVVELKLTTNVQRQESFKKYYDLLNAKKMLSIQVVSPKNKIDKIIAPFKLNKYTVPDWWNEYNTSKHNLPFGALVRMGNVLNALGGLAVLHDIGELVIRTANTNDLLDASKWREYRNDFVNDYLRVKNSNLTTGFIHSATRGFSFYKSKIFYYMCEYR